MPHTSHSSSNRKRSAGVLLHPTSLPGRFGIGDLGDELIEFLDWASLAGLRIWQILPLNPPGYGNSPYGCLSSCAGNPMLISPQRLAESGWVTNETLAKVPLFSESHADFDAVSAWKWSLLRQAWQNVTDRSELDRFVDAEHAWLDDFALYMTMKQQTGGASWCDWDPKLARREPEALRNAQAELAEEIAFQKFVQWVFFRQWESVREAAVARNIQILGDVPIYVAHDSADVWSRPEIFQLDELGQPEFVAGVPPDYFSATGQRWGNPLYRWDLLRATGFDWWIARLRANLRLADLIRLDHFRGFAAYWEIPAHEPTAIHGRWVPGPGLALFDAFRDALGGLPLIAEDLGFITPEVEELRANTRLPGMKILQFGFSELDSPHMPHRYEPETVVYTGTHDNDTASGWFTNAPPHERQLARDYLGEDCADIAQSLIRTAYTSVAEIAIIPAQDILGLGTEARMNRPGASQDNWSWRLRPGALTNAHAAALRRLAELSGRLG